MPWSLEIHHIDVGGNGDATLIVARKRIRRERAAAKAFRTQLSFTRSCFLHNHVL